MGLTQINPFLALISYFYKVNVTYRHCYLKKKEKKTPKNVNLQQLKNGKKKIKKSEVTLSNKSYYDSRHIIYIPVIYFKEFISKYSINEITL